MGGIDIKKDFDGVVRVLMDAAFDATAIYEADGAPVIAALTEPGSKARNERGTLQISKFISIGKKFWPKQAA